MAEWFKAAVLKTVVPKVPWDYFKSYLFRHTRKKNMIDEAKIDKAAESIQKMMEKEYGKESVGLMSDEDSLSNISISCSSRSDVVDFVLLAGRELGVDGKLVPFGRVLGIAGLEAAGKSTLCAQIAAETQKIGGLVIFVDTEDRVDQTYFEQLGVNTSKVISIRENKIEDIFRKQFMLINHIKKVFPDVPVALFWDSIGGSSLLKEDEDPMGDESYGKEAKKMAQGLKQINHLIAKSKIAYVYTNHLYAKMNAGMGDPWETSGGQKLKYFTTVLLILKKVGQITEIDENGNKTTIGNKVLVRAKKNSMGPIQREMEAAVIGGRGFDNDWTVRELAENKKIIAKAGAWSTCKFPSGKEVKFQGWNGFLEKVVTDPEYPELKKLAWAKL